MMHHLWFPCRVRYYSHFQIVVRESHSGHLSAADVWCWYGTEGEISIVVVRSDAKCLDFPVMSFPFGLCAVSHCHHGEKHVSLYSGHTQFRFYYFISSDFRLPMAHCFDVTSMFLEVQCHWLGTKLDVAGHLISQHLWCPDQSSPKNFEVSALFWELCAPVPDIQWCGFVYLVVWLWRSKQWKCFQSTDWLCSSEGADDMLVVGTQSF